VMFAGGDDHQAQRRPRLVVADRHGPQWGPQARTHEHRIYAASSAGAKGGWYRWDQERSHLVGLADR
jgi:hypothetical protein